MGVLSSYQRVPVPNPDSTSPHLRMGWFYPALRPDVPAGFSSIRGSRSAPCSPHLTAPGSRSSRAPRRRSLAKGAWSRSNSPSPCGSIAAHPPQVPIGPRPLNLHSDSPVSSPSASLIGSPAPRPPAVGAWPGSAAPESFRHRCRRSMAAVPPDSWQPPTVSMETT